MAYMPMAPQAITVIEYLHAHPNANRHQIERRLTEVHGPGHSAVHQVFSFIRNVAGQEILRCDRTMKPPTYRLALSAADAYDYVVDRKRKVRNEASNLVRILDRCEAKYPGDVNVRLARAMLSSVVAIFDAAG